ncbi:MAG: cyclic pyranopterin monophosphate synthase MoaC [Anaerohalosphaera sp.]|nr:cyclic pyranopterin monophosphate synthase MoaC [Anaerohalosphaera sp.]
MKKLTHTDEQGKAKMVDVSGKTNQLRYAVASGMISMSAQTLSLITNNQIKKGDVLTVAKIAGIQAAKKTSNLIPLCHPLILDKIDVTLHLTDKGVVAQSEIRCIGRTGVEMEALTAVSTALLTVYDMCKAVDKKMRIGEIKLVRKVKQDVE